MRETDFDQFTAMLDAVLGMYPRPAPVTTAQRAMFFRAVSGYSLAEVQAGFDGHVKDPTRGRFVPLPADVLAQIEAAHAHHDTRPGPEEAWAIAVRAADEAATVVWTTEAAEAWAVAKPVLDLGDEVGARMAFREAYARLTEQARRTRQPASWFASLGHDPARRIAEVDKAVEQGRLTRADYPQLPAPNSAIPLLEMAGRADAPPGARALLQLIRDRLVAGRSNRHPMQWAHDLREREEAGEILSAYQRSCYREALGSSFGNAADRGPTFTAPPLETLPPAMYADRLAAANRSAA